VAWLRSATSLPIVAKGIMAAPDAVAAAGAGVDAVIVSNHGGRLGSTVATVEALPAVVDAVGGRLEVYVDGGVRTGADVVKALALGARAVLIGRPVFWGLADEGEAGLLRLLDLLREEIEVTMMLSGVPSVVAIDRSLVVLPR
jgi:4-hydroxymandelate oxidase